MENDDQQIGNVLSRREMFTMFSTAAGTALFVASAAEQCDSAQAASRTLAAATVTPPSCLVRPEQTEGPLFVDDKLLRSDIRSDPTDGSVKQGVPLRLVFRASQLKGASCTPLAGATVDVWHCDALGVYSDAQGSRFGNTKGKKFLRGYQLTNAGGTAQFLTIYPGWYQGRAVHIHFKLRTVPTSGIGHEFTSQLYFDDALTDRVHAQAPYASKGQRTLQNALDGIFQNGGEQLLLEPAKEGQGYVATFDVALHII